MAETEIRFYMGPLNELLHGKNGPVGKHLASEGIRIVNRARLNCTGPPHGYYKGTDYPSSPGSGPGVRTGRLRDSIAWELVDAGGEIELQVGTNVPYGLYLEKRSNSPYPWLLPAFEACGY